jgi:hypothetical protein
MITQPSPLDKAYIVAVGGIAAQVELPDGNLDADTCAISDALLDKASLEEIELIEDYPGESLAISVALGILYLRQHSWYADTLELDYQSLRLPDFICELQERLQNPES